VTLAGPGAPIATTIIGAGGRIPPATVIEDDSAPGIETGNTFDPAQDGIDFYESLEGMKVGLDDAVAVGPTNNFGEIPVVGDGGATAGVRTGRGGVVVSPNDFNPERVFLDDAILPAEPKVDVNDRFATVRGVMDYNFGNFKLQVTEPLVEIDGALRREVAASGTADQLTVASFNVENLDPTDPPSKFAELAGLIVHNLSAPDVVGVQEIQDNDGATGGTSSPVVDASQTYGMLIAAIHAAGGPTYEFRQVDPVDDQDGGEPGGNIRVGVLFNPARVKFFDEPGGDSTTPNAVDGRSGGAHLRYNPGRIDPTNTAFANSRKPLAVEFRFKGERVFVIVNHFNSKGGDDPLFGRFQPPVRSSEAQRHQQAAIVNDFVDQILTANKNALVVVLGDLNDFEFSRTVEILKGDGDLVNLMDTLPKAERYSYVFEGNSQVLDQMLVSRRLLVKGRPQYDVVHVNSEFADQASDHEPQVARFVIR
jgi:predicted extracellular nuclease